MSQNGDRCRDEIAPHCVLAQEFVFFFFPVSNVASLSQKFKTKEDKALEMLETVQVSKGVKVTRGGCKKESELEGE